MSLDPHNRFAWQSAFIPVLFVILIVLVTTSISITGIILVRRQQGATQLLLNRQALILGKLQLTLDRVDMNGERSTEFHCAFGHILVKSVPDESSGIKAYLRTVCQQFP